MNPSVLDDIHPHSFEPYLHGLAGLAPSLPPKVRVNGVAPVGYEQALRDLGQKGPGPLAIYIHVPFCPTRCNFCACTTNVTHDPGTIDAYLDSLEDELGLVASHLGRGRAVHHLHLGGGTPNHLRDDHLTRLMEIVDDHFRVPESALACIECNPRRTSPQQLELLRELGFCSLSLQDGAVVARTSPLRKLPGTFRVRSEIRSVRGGSSYRLPYWSGGDSAP